MERVAVGSASFKDGAQLVFFVQRRMIAGALRFAGITDEAVLTESVSYTHLDVYKRQV